MSNTMDCQQVARWLDQYAASELSGQERADGARALARLRGLPGRVAGRARPRCAHSCSARPPPPGRLPRPGPCQATRRSVPGWTSAQRLPRRGSVTSRRRPTPRMRSYTLRGSPPDAALLATIPERAWQERRRPRKRILTDDLTLRSFTERDYDSVALGLEQQSPPVDEFDWFAHIDALIKRERRLSRKGLFRDLLRSCRRQPASTATPGCGSRSSRDGARSGWATWRSTTPAGTSKARPWTTTCSTSIGDRASRQQAVTGVLSYCWTDLGLHRVEARRGRGQHAQHPLRRALGHGLRRRPAARCLYQPALAKSPRLLGARNGPRARPGWLGHAGQFLRLFRTHGDPEVQRRYAPVLRT